MNAEASTATPRDVSRAIPRSRSVDQTAGLALLLSGALGLVTTILAASAVRDLAKPSTGAYDVSGAVMTVSDLLLLAGVLRLRASSLLRPGRLRSAALGVAIVGCAGVVVGEVVLRVNHGVGNGIFAGVGPLQGLGMVLIGVAILKTGALTGQLRWAALATGVYVLGILGPVLAASGGENLTALAGLHALVAVTGLSFLGPVSARAQD